MKLPKGKTSYEILIVLIVVLLAVYTHAQEPGVVSDATTTESSPEVLGSTTPPTAVTENLRTEHRVQLLKRFQDRIFNLARNVSNRLNATINRFQNISDRLDSRIVKLKNSGMDTSLAEAKLTEAKNSLAEARSRHEALPSVQQVLVSDTPRESFNNVRTNFLETRNLLKKAHAQLTETVVLLKNAPAEQRTSTEEGTSTETVTE